MIQNKLFFIFEKLEPEKIWNFYWINDPCYLCVHCKHCFLFIYFLCPLLSVVVSLCTMLHFNELADQLESTLIIN